MDKRLLVVSNRKAFDGVSAFTAVPVETNPHTLELIRQVYSFRFPEYYFTWLMDLDRLGLGWEIGQKYRIWTGEIDTILGYDMYGFVYVRGRDGLRKHITPREYYQDTQVS